MLEMTINIRFQIEKILDENRPKIEDIINHLLKINEEKWKEFETKVREVCDDDCLVKTFKEEDLTRYITVKKEEAKINRLTEEKHLIAEVPFTFDIEKAIDDWYIPF